MADAYDRAAFLARFLAAIKPVHDSIAGLRGIACPQVKTRTAPATSPAPDPPPTAADLEFERVRAAACARIDAERQARAADDAAAAFILASRAKARALTTYRPKGT